MKQLYTFKALFLLVLLIFLGRPMLPQYRSHVAYMANGDQVARLLDHKPGHQDNGNGNGNDNGKGNPKDTTPPPSDTTGTEPPPPPPDTTGTEPPPPPPDTTGTEPPPPPPPTDTTGTEPPPPPSDTTGTEPPPPPPPPPPTDTTGTEPPPPPSDTTGTEPPPPPPPPPPTDTTGTEPPPPPPDTDPPQQPGVKATATISGIDSVCSGESGELLVKLTGSPPWDVSVLFNGAPFKTISNIRTTDYILKVNQPGKYTLSAVEDAFSRGTVAGSGEVRLRSQPSGSLSGTGTFCGDGNATLNVTLTGVPPWKFTYQINSGNSVTVNHVTSSPGQIMADEAGTYKLLDVYDRYCEGRASGNAVITRSEAPEVEITGLEDSYSQQSTEWIVINGSPSGGQFSGSGVLHHENKWYFVPSLAKPGNNYIVYKYRQSTSSCYGYDTVNVRVYETTADILFSRERTGYCTNEAPFQITGINKTGGGTGTFSISGGKGLTDLGNNTATIDPSELSGGEYTVTYKTSDGTEVERTVEIGENLKADFTWGTECYNPGQPLHFTNTSESSFGTLGSNSFQWKIYGKSDTVTWSSQEISYNFPEPGTYTVSLRAVNSFGCIDTAVRVLSLQPVFELAGQNYFEDFENPTKWQSAQVTSKNSWELGMPEKHGFPVRGFNSAWSGQKCWYTYITESPVPEEESWITSPCFDFTGTQKPTFIARVWRSFADNHDGASLQYSTDNGKNWNSVGSINDGINWFNSYYGPAGKQWVGWTALKDTGWVEIRHALDFLSDEPQVIFRIHYQASGEAFWNDGIAVDDIHIEERNRNLLMEHFTNSSDHNSAVADSILYQVIRASGTNIIDLHYHTGEPAGDPLNGDNPVIPSTRQLYYSINSVPYTLINGGTIESDQIDYISKSPNPNVLAVKSLFDSDFKLEVYSTTEGDSLNAQIVITATKDVPKKEISLRIAVIESLIDGVSGNNGTHYFRNVVKTMLPDAAGTAIFKEWAVGEMIVENVSWSMENIYDSSTIRVVAFLQDETTKEVYQAEMDRRELLTGNEDAPALPQPGFSVYPNPADERLFIKMEKPGNERIVEVIGYLGNTVYSGKINQGESVHEVQLSSVAPGMYLIRVSEPGMVTGTRKVIIRK